MKIIQMLPSLAFGDAVSNDALAIRDVLSQLGYETRIYAENIQYKLQGHARAYRRMERTRKSDVVLYHHSIGTDMAFDFEKLSCRKVMIYHNITPPEFFDGYDNRSKRLMVYGQATTKCLADKVDYCLADSEYNKQELRAMGYTCPIDVRPVFIPLLDYEKSPARRFWSGIRAMDIRIFCSSAAFPPIKNRRMLSALFITIKETSTANPA